MKLRDEKRTRIHQHFENQLDSKNLGQISTDDGIYLILLEIKELLKELLEKGIPEEKTAEPQPAVQTLTEKKSQGWKFWRK